MNFLDISTSKSEPKPQCLYHFWLGNALRASATCTLSAVHLPKVLRTWGAFSVWTSKRASRQAACTFWTSERPKVFQTWSVFAHFGFQMCFAPQLHAIFDLSSGALGSLLFSTSGATNHWKNTVFCDFSTFWGTCIFFPLTLSLLFSLLLFSSLTLPTSAASSVHIVGSLTSKFPSTGWLVLLVGRPFS